MAMAIQSSHHGAGLASMAVAQAGLAWPGPTLAQTQQQAAGEMDDGWPSWRSMSLCCGFE